MSSDDGNKATPISLDRVLAHGSVPTLPGVAMRLLEMTGNPDIQLSEFAGLIQNDPGLASKVLKTVNSSFYGLPKPCPSIERAIAMLGLRAIKSLVLGFSMVNLTRGMGQDIDLDQFWKYTIVSAAAARQIATLAKVGEPDEVFAAALFQDIGVLTMLAVYPADYSPLMELAQNNHHDLLRLEQEKNGFDHTCVGSALAKKWRMPQSMINAIKHHHDNEPPESEDQQLMKCVMLGERMAAVMTSGDSGKGLTELHVIADQWFGHNDECVQTLIEEVKQSSYEIAKLLDKQIGEVPSAQELMQRANERLLETQLETQREAEEAQRDAMTDGLTGVPNRKHFDELVVKAVGDAMATRSSVAVLFSDADKFKYVNDTFGHGCGDAVLIELANRIARAVGELGTVCRYGGEEFVVVLPGMDLTRATETGEAIRQAVESLPFDLSGVRGGPDEPLPRTVSVGVAAWSDGEEQVTAEQLVQRADKAVYTAKEAGRNCVKRWGTDIGRRAQERRADLAAHIGVSQDALPTDGTTHVLLIEDDPLAARLMQTMLCQNNGVTVEIKDDGRQAVEYLRDAQGPGKRLPDLIICDMNIPGFNGLQIVRALKANTRFSRIPIIVISASLDEVQQKAFANEGVHQAYSKVEISADLKSWCTEILSSLQIAA